MADPVDTITDQWGPHKDVDDRAFYACSPHRIETAARLIRAHPYAGQAESAIRLLPEWTQWCLERGGLSDGGRDGRGLDGDAAARSLTAAVSLVLRGISRVLHGVPGLTRCLPGLTPGARACR
jgi:hypothetical protein